MNLETLFHKASRRGCVSSSRVSQGSTYLAQLVASPASEPCYALVRCLVPTGFVLMAESRPLVHRARNGSYFVLSPGTDSLFSKVDVKYPWASKDEALEAVGTEAPRVGMGATGLFFVRDVDRSARYTRAEKGDVISAVMSHLAFMVCRPTDAAPLAGDPYFAADGSMYDLVPIKFEILEE